MGEPPVCPCDGGDDPRAISNPPAQSQIDYRVGDYRSFRHALLGTPPAPFAPEKQLKDWRPGIGGDLGVQMLEWWAYLADILTFYNERIANESYLRTATQPENLRRLIRTLGYRPKPGVAATGTLAALVGGHQPVTLPKGFAIDSKPGPGEQPQTFELDADTIVTPRGAVPADPPAFAFAPDATHFLIAGNKPAFKAGAKLMLEHRNGAFAPLLLTVKSISTETAADGSIHSSVSFEASGTLPATARARDLALLLPTQTMPSSSISNSAVANDKLHLAGIVRDIRAGDHVMVSEKGTDKLRRVASVTETVWYANHATGKTPEVAPPSPNIPIVVMHTVVKLVVPFSAHDNSPSKTLAVKGDLLNSVVQDVISQLNVEQAKAATPAPQAVIGSATVTATLSYGWRSAGQLLDQPVTSYSGGPLKARAPATFPQDGSHPILLADAADAGMSGDGLFDKELFGKELSPDRGGLIVSNLSPPATLETPLVVHYNLLPVSRGKTVAAEVLGSGNAGVAGQSFALKKKPLTYLAQGDGVASTLRVWVGGREWIEAASFYDQPADAEIFVTREDDDQQTHVLFGDGVNGARLPTNANNVVASYRFGSGAKSPAAGALTVIAKPYPNLKSLKNPVAVGGGGDPDPADKIRRLAPRSAMSFGRAISGDDYQVIAAQAPGVTRTQAVWSFDAATQRSAVTVYVGDDGDALKSAAKAIKATADPHRHVVLAQAVPIALSLSLQLVVDRRYIAADVAANVTSALLDDDSGLFGARRLGIGEAVFDSQVAAACLGIAGVTAINGLSFSTATAVLAGERHAPGEGAFYALAPQRLSITTGSA